MAITHARDETFEAPEFFSGFRSEKIERGPAALERFKNVIFKLY